MEEDQVEVTLEPTLEDDIVIVEAPEEKPKVELTVDDGIEALRRELEAEKAARVRAEQQAQQARDQVKVATHEKADSDIRMLDNAIETETRNKEILKQNLRDAVANGDTDMQADILMAINQTDRNINDISRGKQQYEAQLRAVPQVTDKVEALAAQLQPKSAEWVRANPDIVNDDRKAQRLQRAHFDAIDDGIAPESDEYFQFLETRMNINNRREQPMQDAAMSEASESTSGRKASSPPAAPVSRSGTGTGGRPNVVSLTRAEQEAARDMGMTPKEYAENKIALIKSGRMAG